MCIVPNAFFIHELNEVSLCIHSKMESEKIKKEPASFSELDKLAFWCRPMFNDVFKREYGKSTALVNTILALQLNGIEVPPVCLSPAIEKEVAVQRKRLGLHIDTTSILSPGHEVSGLPCQHHHLLTTTIEEQKAGDLKRMFSSATATSEEQKPRDFSDEEENKDWFSDTMERPELDPILKAVVERLPICSLASSSSSP
jgi:hypothetical protein